MRRAMLVTILVLLMGGVSAAPTTRPASGDWTGTVVTLGHAIADNRIELLPQLLASEATICRFDGKTVRPGRLFSLARQRTLLFSRAYPHAPETLATDLSDAARKWKLPDAIRSIFVVHEGELEKRANRTALRWVTRSLNIDPPIPVGVLALWCADPDNGNDGEVIFVLLKGTPDATGQLRISSVVFGEPIADGQ